MSIEIFDLGTIAYTKALDWQKALAEKRKEEQISDTLLLLEHPPIYTVGKRDSSVDIKKSPEWLKQHGLHIKKTDRGGKITYHGPGQMVAYFIFRLEKPIGDFVHEIEEVLIQLLEHFHIEGVRDPKNPGVWVRDNKIAALGFHVDRGVTRHGISLNVSCDLKPYQYIQACGIPDRGITSLEKELGWAPSMQDIKLLFLQKLTKQLRQPIHVVGTMSSAAE